MDSDVNTFRHVVSRIDQEPSFVSLSGPTVQIEKRRFPRLHHLSVRRLILSPGAVYEPHRHANAYELGYCVRGDADAEFILAFSQAEPEDFGLSDAFDAMPESVLANKAGSRLNFARVGGDQDIFSLDTSREVETQAAIPMHANITQRRIARPIARGKGIAS